MNKALLIPLHRGWPAAALCCVCVSVLALRIAMPFATTAALIVLFRLLLSRIAERAADQWLDVILTSCFYVRLVLAVSFYLASLLALPLLTSLQLGGGMWSFAPDAQLYDTAAKLVVHAWQTGAPLPAGYGGGFYILIVAIEYLLTGAHMLHAIVVNVALGTASAALAYGIARRFAGEASGRVGAVLIGFWPSSVLWSTQLLREAVTGFLVLSALYGCIRLFQEADRPASAAASRVMALLCLIAVAASTFVLGSGPSLYALALAAATVGVFGVLAISAVLGRRTRRALFLLVLMVAAVSGTFAGRATSILYVFDPQVWLGAGTVNDTRPLPAPPTAGTGSSARALPRVAPPVPTSILGRVVHHGVGLAVAVVNVPKTIASLRRAQVIAAGEAPLYPNADVSTFPHLISFAPRGALSAAFAPSPVDALRRGNASGSMRYLSLVETLLIYAVSFLAVTAVIRHRRRAEVWLLAMYFSCGIAVLGVTIANLGGMFRYRVPFFLAVMLLATACRATDRGTPARSPASFGVV